MRFTSDNAARWTTRPQSERPGALWVVSSIAGSRFEPATGRVSRNFRLRVLVASPCRWHAAVQVLNGVGSSSSSVGRVFAAASGPEGLTRPLTVRNSRSSSDRSTVRLLRVPSTTRRASRTGQSDASSLPRHSRPVIRPPPSPSKPDGGSTIGALGWRVGLNMTTRGSSKGISSRTSPIASSPNLTRQDGSAMAALISRAGL